MASINTIVKRKQYLWLGIVVVGTASAIGGALYLSDVDMSGNGETVAEQEPVPDMTGVVDTTFDDKVRQHATTEMQVTAAQMQKQYEEIRRELDVLNKQRGDDQRRIEKLGQDNAALAEQVKALGANPVTATGEPVPQMPASPPGPEGEPQPGNTPVSFPPQGSVAVPPPTAFYPGNGVTPPPQVTYQSVPVPNRIQRKVFTRNEGKQGPSLPYIPSGSFAKAMLIEGADANASGRPCDDGADCWSGVLYREITTPFLVRGFFPDVLCLSSYCAGRSGCVTGMMLALILLINKQHNTGYL